jgi:hypothetical protein
MVNSFNLFIGIFIILGAIISFIYILGESKKTEKGDHTLNANYIQVFGGLIMLLIVGLVLIIKELKKIL